MIFLCILTGLIIGFAGFIGLATLSFKGGRKLLNPPYALWMISMALSCLLSIFILASYNLEHKFVFTEVQFLVVMATMPFTIRPFTRGQHLLFFAPEIFTNLYLVAPLIICAIISVFAFGEGHLIAVADPVIIHNIDTLSFSFGSLGYLLVVYGLVSLIFAGAFLIREYKKEETQTKRSTTWALVVFSGYSLWFSFLVGASSDIRSLQLFNAFASLLGALIYWGIMRNNLFVSTLSSTLQLADHLPIGIITLDQWDNVTFKSQAVDSFLLPEEAKFQNIQSLQNYPEVIEAIRSKKNKVVEAHNHDRTRSFVVSVEFFDLGFLKGQSCFVAFNDSTTVTKKMDGLKKTIFDQSKQIEHLMERSSFREKLLSIISHDLVGNFRGVELTLSYLQRQTPSPITQFSQEEILTSLQESTMSTRQLLENLVCWTKLQDTTFAFDIKPVKLARLLKQLQHVLGPLAEVGKVELNVNSDLTRESIDVDEQMVSIVLRNIVSNAIKASDPGGHVDLSITENNDYFQFAVTNGIKRKNDAGMTIGDQQLFNDIVYSGFGVGLKICQEICQAMNATLSQHDSEDLRTCVDFKLPIKPIDSGVTSTT